MRSYGATEPERAVERVFAKHAYAEAEQTKLQPEDLQLLLAICHENQRANERTK